MNEYMQERIPVHSVAKRINELAQDGWQYIETIEHIPAPTYANGGSAGPAKRILLFRRENKTKA